MLDIIFIFIGAGCGGVLRYLTANFAYTVFGRDFPYGTIIVNVSGCFLMGIIFILLTQKFSGMEAKLRPLLLIGLLGGYTTFSAFSMDTLNLMENGARVSAMANVFVSVICCLTASWLGMMLARQW